MTDKDHLAEALATIQNEVKNIRETVSKMGDTFEKMCEKVEKNITKTAVLENRINIMGRILWGVGGTMGVAILGLIGKIIIESYKILTTRNLLGQ